jgi:hypothetical protein
LGFFFFFFFFFFFVFLSVEEWGVWSRRVGR